MSNAIYHKSSKGRPAYITKDGERLATFLNQPTYANGVKMAQALSDAAAAPPIMEHGDPQRQHIDELLQIGSPEHRFNPNDPSGRWGGASEEPAAKQPDPDPENLKIERGTAWQERCQQVGKSLVIMSGSIDA